MNVPLVKKLTKLMREAADNMDAGNSSLTEGEAMTLMGIFCHEEMSKARACLYLNISRSKFDELVRLGQLPRGKKIMGYKELRWYKDELDEYVKQMKK